MTRYLCLTASFGVFALWAISGDLSAQTAAPYAGEERREIKALSVEETDDLLQGRGMGLAKAAELNRYPGPSHALDFAEQLKLTAGQREGLRLAFARMTERAKALGIEVLEAERELDSTFANRSIVSARLIEMTSRIGIEQAQLRAVHLEAHLKTAALLFDEQIARYDALRGYGVASPPTASVGHGGHSSGKD